MNKRFFIHTVTLFHLENSEYTSKVYKQVYFNHTERINSIDSGVENASTGTIYIPTEAKLDIEKDDYVVEGDFSNTEFNLDKMQQSNQVYQVVSIDDNRKGNLQHYQIGVSG